MLKSAYKKLQKLPIVDQRTILKKIDTILSNPENLDIKKLKEYDGFFRMWVGDFRIVFLINRQDKQIIIAAIGHRREVYSSISHLKNYD